MDASDPGEGVPSPANQSFSQMQEPFLPPSTESPCKPPKNVDWSRAFLDNKYFAAEETPDAIPPLPFSRPIQLSNKNLFAFCHQEEEKEHPITSYLTDQEAAPSYALAKSPHTERTIRSSRHSRTGNKSNYDSEDSFTSINTDIQNAVQSLAQEQPRPSQDSASILAQTPKAALKSLKSSTDAPPTPTEGMPPPLAPQSLPLGQELGPSSSFTAGQTIGPPPPPPPYFHPSSLQMYGSFSGNPAYFEGLPTEGGLTHHQSQQHFAIPMYSSNQSQQEGVVNLSALSLNDLRHHTLYSSSSSSCNFYSRKKSIGSNRSSASISSTSTQKSSNRKNTEKDLQYVLVNAYQMSKDQKRCIRLQKKIEEERTNEEFMSILFTRLIPFFDELMMDPFANYCCQKLIVQAKNEHFDQILAKIGDKFVEICLNTHGTRAGQKLVETIPLNDERTTYITKHMSAHVVRMATNQHGNHVVNICLKRFAFADKEFIISEVSEACVAVSNHVQGCMVIQNCLQYSNSEQRERLSWRIIECSKDLVENKYGNYVVQHVIKMRDMKKNFEIARMLSANLRLFST